MALIEIRRLTLSDVEDFRTIRLAALQREPEAFGSTYELEAVQPISEFSDRLATSTIFGALQRVGLWAWLGTSRELDRSTVTRDLSGVSMCSPRREVKGLLPHGWMRFFARREELWNNGRGPLYLATEPLSRCIGSLNLNRMALSRGRGNATRNIGMKCGGYDLCGSGEGLDEMQLAERLPPSLIGDGQGDIEQQPSDETLAERPGRNAPPAIISNIWLIRGTGEFAVAAIIAQKLLILVSRLA